MRLRDKSRPSRQARLPLDWLNSFLIQAIHDHALRTFLRAQRKRNHISLYRRKGREIKKKKRKKKRKFVGKRIVLSESVYDIERNEIIKRGRKRK